MELGMIGLGRMDANMTRRLMKTGYVCVVHDTQPEAISALHADGAIQLLSAMRHAFGGHLQKPAEEAR